MRFESSTNKIRELLDAGDIWFAKRVAKALVLTINDNCKDSELRGKYYDQIRKLCGTYVCIGDILEEHRYKSEALRAAKARFKGVWWK